MSCHWNPVHLQQAPQTLTTNNLHKQGQDLENHRDRLEKWYAVVGGPVGAPEVGGSEGPPEDVGATEIDGAVLSSSP